MNHVNWCTTLDDATITLLRAQITEIHKLNARMPAYHAPRHTAWIARIERTLAEQESK